MQKYLYLMQSDDGFCKVGISANPQSRLNNIRTSTARGVNIVRTYGPFNLPFAIEANCHNALKAHSFSGEWFNCTAELVIETIEKCIAAFVDSESVPVKRSGHSAGAELLLLCMDADERVEKYKALAIQAMQMAERTLERFDAMVDERDDALAMVKIHEDIAKSYKVLAERAST